ncbi:hypothetical protein MMC08_007647, partial [Hypocenomyce scalaris]|nr:hypothetical protein [Hypocenomyce scalaris]
MLPPSSPHQYQPQNNVQQPPSRVPPPPPPFSGGRDLPALSSITRPGSSMSILSMLGSDSDRAPREPIVSGHMNGASSMSGVSALSPASRSMPAPSPPRHSLEIGSLFRRAHTPDSYSVAEPQGPRPSRAFSGGPPHRPFSALQTTSPEARKFGPPLRAHQAREQYSPTSESAFPQEHHQLHNGRSSIDRMVPRPTSQPSGYRTPPFENEEGMLQHSVRLEAQEYRHGPNRIPGEFPNVPRDGRELGWERANRDHSGPQNPYTQRAQSSAMDNAPRTAAPLNSTPARSNGAQDTAYPFLSRSTINTGPSDQLQRPAADPPASRTIAPNPGNRHNATQSPVSPEFSRRIHEARSLGDRPPHPEFTQPPSQNQARLFSPTGDKRSTYTPRMSYRGALDEDVLHPVHRADQQQKGLDEVQQQQRSSLSLAIENSKRTGRISPMPQAVQGAQGQMNGPASTPGIKSEFARMFSGIGSGAGSVISGGSGTPTPLPPSPPRREDAEGRTPFGTRSDLSELKVPRVASRVGKRSRKIKEDEMKVDSESGDGRRTPGMSTRGAKRSKH